MEVVRQLLDEFVFGKRKAQKSATMGTYPYRSEQFEYNSKLEEEYFQAAVNGGRRAVDKELNKDVLASNVRELLTLFDM